MLEEYRRKRRPGATPEPFPEEAAASAGRPRFVVHRHAARSLHYDLRLERDGVLASWAVPKGIPLRRGERHLAVHVEDHPLEYADFEGEIPAGEYGAGTVEIWDRGTYELLEEKPNGGLTVRLHGQRLRGVWTLVPARLAGDPQNWLLLRRDEAAAERESAAARYAPMLASTSETLPQGPGWAYEPKWDGFRALVMLAGGEVTLTSRNGKDLTGRFPEVARAARLGVRTSDAVLDGEICALDERGRSRFSLLQEGRGVTVLVLFDLLELEGEPLLDLPLAERRARLERIVDAGARGVLLSPQLEDGEALLAAAREQGLEGVIAKRLDSRYQPGRRSQDWRKVKVRARQEVVIAGYTKGKGRRASGFGALVVGVREAGRLRWVGNVGTGFTEAEIGRLLERFRPLVRAQCPFPDPPRMPRVRPADVVWLEPRLVCEVEFAEWTHEGRLRAPVYLGLREDKPAVEVRKEREPLPPVIRKGRRELRLSNLDKLFWPEEGITKGDLIAYYRDVAEVLVPHLRQRPFTMKRYPDGWQGKHFFQKQAPSHMPSWIKRAPLPASTRAGETRTIEYALVDDELALLWMANMACIDLHVWSSRADKPERPDWVVFDLDPAEDASFDDVVEVARLVKETLELLDLESYPKTSGSRGIHVLVPIARRHTFAETRDFAAIVAAALARTHPGLVTTEWSKRKRRGVLVDANQNRLGATNASVYSVRPRAGAPVSTPLRWEEVRAGLDPSAFTMDAVLDRVAREGDLFAGVLGGRQSLTRALRALR
ncbi:MAG TPA: DNA ligase D [Gaiellaceae bacterium]|nr:DNA ligase D [Gaiellaceae bacterium]